MVNETILIMCMIVVLFFELAMLEHMIELDSRWLEEFDKNDDD